MTYYEAMNSLNGMLFGSGGSLLFGEDRQKSLLRQSPLFSRRAMWKMGFFEPFFDKEGTVNDSDRFALIEDGVVISPYTDKKTAATFNLTHTGSAGGSTMACLS